MTWLPPLHLDGVRTSSFTPGLGVNGADEPREEETERDDDEPVLLGAQRFGRGRRCREKRGRGEEGRAAHDHVRHDPIESAPLARPRNA